MFSFKKEDLAIDNLKSLVKEPKYFGMGFFILELDNGEELHIWSKDLETTCNNPHTHDHRVHGQVLLGEFCHRIHQFVPSVSYCTIEEKITKFCDDEDCIVSSRGELFEIEEYHLSPGSTHYLAPGVIHEVDVNGDCVTLVKRGKEDITHAKLYEDLVDGGGKPFRKDMPIEQRWNLISGVLERESKNV